MFYYHYYYYKTRRFSHISPTLKSSHKLKIDRIQYKVLSLTYKTLPSQKPSYLYNHLNLQSASLQSSAHSSSVITLQRPPVKSHLKITIDHSLTMHAPAALWNSRPKELRYRVCHTSSINLLIIFSLSPQLSSTPG